MQRRNNLALVAAAALAAALAACGNGGHGTTSGTGGGSSMGTGGTGGATTTTSSGPCTEAWICTPWETDGTGDMGTRTCTDSNACGTTDDKPLEAVTLPALDLDYFKCQVHPILALKCSMLGCHGTEQGRAFRDYARGRKRLAGQMLSNPSCGSGSTPSDGCDGANQCLCAAPLTDAEWRKNYDAARGFALDVTGKSFPKAQMDKSDLLAQPVVSGKAHAGIHLFKKNDAEYAVVKNWLTGTKLGMACP